MGGMPLGCEVWARVATATLLPALLGAAAPPALPEAVLERQVAAMGTVLRLEVTAASRPLALAASEAAVGAVAAVEERLSTWRTDSELAALNRHPPGVEFALSPQLAADLQLAARIWRETDGAFDPAIGALLQAWDVRGTGRRPGRAELAAARQASGLALLTLTPRTAVRLHPGVRLEEGGFGKGVGLDAALAALTAAGATGAVLDFGGQVAVLPSPSGYEVAVAHPRQRAREIARVCLAAGSLATSGNGSRPRRRPHLFDPRTGRPAADFGSVSVWAASAAEADALATALFVLGPARALAWAEQHTQVGVLVVEMQRGDAQVRVSRALLEGRLPATILPANDRAADVRKVRKPCASF